MTSESLVINTDRHGQHMLGFTFILFLVAQLLFEVKWLEIVM